MKKSEENKNLVWLKSDSGFTAASHIFYAAYFILVSLLTFHYQLSATAKIQVILSTALLLIVLSIFSLSKSLREKKSLSFIPDLFTLLALAVTVFAYGETNLLIIGFIIIFVGIEAFTRGFVAYLSAISIILVTIFANIILTTEASYTASSLLDGILIPLAVILAAAVLFRILSNETTKLRTANEFLVKSTNDIKSQKNELDELLNNIGEGLISIDANKKINFFNRAAGNYLNQDKSITLLGKNIDDTLLTTTDDGKFSIADELFAQNGTMKYRNIGLFTKDKSLRISASAEPIRDKAGKVIGGIVLFRDITAERLLEEQKEEFNAIASHELRTPLAVIDGFGFTLLNDKSLKYDEKTKGYITSIVTATESLIQLTNDILTITQVENDQIKINLEKTDPKKIVSEVANAFKNKVKAKKISLKLEVPENLPMVMTDAQKVKEVLTNLCENALKFTTKGSITITALENSKHELEIKVTDTGLGIQKSDQAKIFTKFFRTEDWQTRKTGGTGLGLYISKSLIKQIGGKIGVESKPGVGSTFWFSLPITVKAKTRKTKTEKQLDEFIQDI